MDFKASGNALLWGVQILQGQGTSKCLDPFLRELLDHRATINRENKAR